MPAFQCFNTESTLMSLQQALSVAADQFAGFRTTEGACFTPGRLLENFKTGLYEFRNCCPSTTSFVNLKFLLLNAGSELRNS